MILDTNAISDLLRATEALISVLGQEDHHLPVIALGEYRYGLTRSRLRETLERQLNQWEAIWPVLAIVRETTCHYARIREQLRSDGAPIPENDLWIAALAAQHELALVSKDDHFDRVKGIRRVFWDAGPA